MDDKRLLIVGAGPTGLTAALKAVLAGWTPIIVDRAPNTTDESRAVGINRASLDILEDTGTVPALLDRGLVLNRVRLFYQDKPLATFDLPQSQERPVMIALPQSDTERVLLTRLEDFGISPHWNTHVSAVAQSEHGVTATSQSGEVFEADWMLGADGSRSAVREALGIAFDGTTYPETWSIADAVIDWPWPDTQAMPRLQSDGSVLFLITLGEGRFRIIANREDALQRAKAIVSVRDVVMSDTFKVSLKRVQRYGNGRIWIAGDAAHVHSPVGGMGMNLGMEDAADFVATLTGGATEADFAAYTTRRLKAAKRVLSVSDRGYKLARTTNPVIRAMRNGAIRVFASAGPATRWLARVVFRADERT